MKRAMALDEPELAQLLLRLVPQFQQDQYKLIKGIIPVSLCLTLDILKTIEKTDVQVQRKAEKVAESRNGKGKRKVAFKDDNASKKKKRSSKHCDLCETHSGAKNTHNTVDCKRYEKDGVPKKAFKSKKGNSTGKKFDHQSFKTMEDNFKKVRTEIKKMKKSSHESKKCECDDLSETSNSS